jgi:tRNA threonylcarbamoyladenosine biosynthesis protein TsaE
MIITRIAIERLEETQTLGKLLGEMAIAGDVYALDGDLGTGKTTLTQSIAKGMMVPETCYVTSPSYNIFHEYPGRIPLYHMDFYRLNDADDIIDMGLDDYFYLGGLTVIEWSNKARQILPESRLSLTITMTDSNKRIVSLEYEASYWLDRIKMLSRHFIRGES